MKKMYFIMALCLATTSTMATGMASSTSNYISKSQAKQIALANAGVSAQDAVFVKTEIDNENGKQEIDIEFFTQTTINGVPVYKEYDYDLNAFTGEIISRDMDIEEFNNHINDTDYDGIDDIYDGYNNNVVGATTYISEAEAKQFALRHAGVNMQDAVFIKTEFDNNDGRPEIEVEFFTRSVLNGIPVYKEYDYDLDALTGTVVSADIDVENFNDDDDDRWDNDDRYDWDDDDDDDWDDDNDDWDDDDDDWDDDNDDDWDDDNDDWDDDNDDDWDDDNDDDWDDDDDDDWDDDDDDDRWDD